MKKEYFSNPNVIKAQTVTITQGAMKALNRKPKSAKVKKPIKKVTSKKTKQLVIESTEEAQPIISQPYMITIENTGKVDREAVILGKNKYLELPNHGNHKDIKLGSGTTDHKDYLHVVNCVSEKNIEVSQTYLRSENLSQLHETLFFTSEDANGDAITRRINPIMDPYQSLCTIIPLKPIYVVDSSLYIKVKIQAGQSLRITLYPSSKNCGKSSFESLVNLLGYYRKEIHNLHS